MKVIAVHSIRHKVDGKTKIEKPGELFELNAADGWMLESGAVRLPRAHEVPGYKPQLDHDKNGVNGGSIKGAKGAKRGGKGEKDAPDGADSQPGSGDGAQAGDASETGPDSQASGADTQPGGDAGSDLI